MKRCTAIRNALPLLGMLLLSACQTQPPKQADVDGISGATVSHDRIVLPPANENYQVLGHLEGLNNYVVQYDESLYRGGQAYEPDLALQSLEALGIKTIISITPTEEERAFCEIAGIELIEVPFTSDSGPTENNFELYFQVLENSKAPVYLHCKGGSHRAGILGAAYRMKFQDWSYEQAIIEYGRLGGDLKTDYPMLSSLKTFGKRDDLTKSKLTANTDSRTTYKSATN
ncbi:fused DSP-PTPase phosphatase/NAD kinase-like protein [Pontiella agarivorans]|uniref:Tyrosine-protein phosphatase domain-containing protein n=1 Tax=Pontiella agarivorans TaxID=3038953 RepID=A0ABU5MVR0_9BACT|nr:hypothetical protein [Pontiella agarivorans]MDZ8118171.1 hypothetical protein [Pontiella agarivorans]